MTTTGNRTGALVAFVGITVAVLAGCGGEPAAPPAPPAPAPASSAGPLTAPQVPVGREMEAFGRALAMRNISVGRTEADTRRVAEAMCGDLDQGVPPEQVILDVQTGTGLTLNETGYVIGAGVSSFCPANLAKLPQR